jgi:predicted dehydrogenase
MLGSGGVKQVVQDRRSGSIQVIELPAPSLRPGAILVRNAFSVVSPGTERNSVLASRDSYLKTARARPDLVRRVLDTVRREGVLAAYRKVEAKLSGPHALGYSSAGVVIAVGPGAGSHFRIGDRVACCGQDVASHAEIVCVPLNLAARVPDEVPLDDAAFATLGAIALHGVRTVEPQLGGRYAVIGCGIIGLLTVQLLRAHGARVAAFDLAPDLVLRARDCGAESGLAAGTDEQVASALAWTEGLGVDGVIVTAASADDAPMVSAAGMSRDRGRVVAVGFVPFGLPREIAYAKELELRMSRSYGPGRYDSAFEEKGLQYPAGYVRWTETQNLEAFLQELRDGRVRVASLVTHRCDVADAPRAYDLLVARGGTRNLGIVLRYDTASPGADDADGASRLGPIPAVAAPAPITGVVGLGWIGAGAFAKAVLLPIFAGSDDVTLERVATTHGITAHDAQRRFHFKAAGTDVDQVLADPAVQVVAIATRHDSHAALASRALRAGKHVFLEKPLALDERQLGDVEEAARASGCVLLVGFNRRFAPMARAARDAIAGKGPMLATYRVNAGRLPPGHWLNDPDVGGGRIVGEGCHFVDLLSFLTGDAEIRRIQAATAGRPRGPAEDVVIQIEFADGSAGQILYTAHGDPALGKERIEAHAGGTSVVIDDFRSCTIASAGRRRRVTRGGKGHAEEVAAFLASIRRGGPSPIPLPVLVGVSRATLQVEAALAAGDAAVSPTAPPA